MFSFPLFIGLLVFLLFGLFCLVALTTAFKRFQRKDVPKHLHLASKLFFYRYISQLFFPAQESSESLYFASMCAQSVIRFVYTILVFISLQVLIGNPETSILQDISLLQNPWAIFYLFSAFFLLFLLGDYLARVIGNRHPELTTRICSPLAAFFMLLVFPLTFLFLKVFHLFSTNVYLDPIYEPNQEAKQELIAIIEDSDLDTHLDPHDKKLIEAVMEFKDRIAREVMVPRVDISSLSHDTTIEEAAKFLYNEGYSRTPVYKHTLDNIIGVLMYKDVLAKYMEYGQTGDRSILQAPIATLIKNIIYTPETKKISHLLQEFRKKQVHLAIIVDEYGGTEGIVTIEDILEEIVGDIADEYDEEEALFLPLPEGGWLIDARMNILDIEEQLGIEIPQDGDYDTIGGYVFHETGTIPAKGFLIKKPHFELEVLRSNDRRVEKLRIKPAASA